MRGSARSALSVLALALGATLLACATVGGARIDLRDVLRVVLDHENGMANDAAVAILVSVRAPRLVLGLLVGSGLALSGTAMQGLFRNPLVDPGLLGIQAGAGLGAVLAIVGAGPAGTHGVHAASLATFSVPAASFVGAAVAMATVRKVTTLAGGGSSTLILTGLGVSALFQSAMGLVIHRASDAQLRSITFWNLGSLAGATWSGIAAASPCILVGTAMLAARARDLDVLALGDAEAGHLGLDAERVRRLVVVAVCLVVGAAVASAGVLGFVGLVVPNLLRILLGPGHRVLLPASALLGGIVLLVADAIARTAALPAELPLGVVTAALGAPFFLVLVARRRRLGA